MIAAQRTIEELTINRAEAPGDHFFAFVISTSIMIIIITSYAIMSSRLAPREGFEPSASDSESDVLTS